MSKELPKTYNPKETEEKIYKTWEESGFFTPENLPDKREASFSVSIPPPNATGTLHLGHSLEYSLQDAVVRYHRMKGDLTLWLPGTDHAAIATNTKVEKKLIKETGKNRHAIGREAFVKEVEDFVAESRGVMQKQIRQIGASVDWSREAFTMDDKRSLAVKTAFKKMYDAGLIYKDYKVINWDPKGQTSVSDDEVEHRPEKGMLYTFKYSSDFPIEISTTRPETKVGDTAVAIHPDDKRYKQYIGKEFKNIEFAGTKLNIKIIADENIDPEFGTGAVGVTPAHSLVDADIAQRHSLPMVQVINEYAKMTEEAGTLVSGKKTKEAREIIVTWLKENKLLSGEENIDLNISIADRSGGIIEPLPKLQWFVAVNKKFKIKESKIKGIESNSETTLKEIMKKSVENGQIEIMPGRFNKTYFHWINNLRDWNISRQLWYGHRIPVWYKGDETLCDINHPEGSGWEQDPDTLDTWFSSALWTFSTLGWPDKNAPDLKKFHPTSFMNPGYEIIFFWVARMILASGFLLGEVPFKKVYLHGILRDSKGRKFSKSLDNGIDPIEIIDHYGADALRMSLIIGIGPGNDANFDTNKVRGYQHFANKLWNIARFVLLNVTEKPNLNASLKDKDQTKLEEQKELIKDITNDMEEYRYYIAAEKIYHYIWHILADEIIEDSKTDLSSKDLETKESAQRMLLELLMNSLKILHPFMPFVTEEIYSKLPNKNKILLIVEKWPVN
ncbi:MAG: valine--tRNA ligase [Candidatus Yanofskybacteria bacterium CG10_big_fil_rev_8_21_14_0_10_36_16]|uniref:Valine--tRNA ligase n=1 Tax=Candidatus Yanofskybacteria bacterium CG10_big_fil_rev_8_21_14_0_10_36_16 TaxID=1975096 RepID=A0A2J0Q6B5_9BACT|nr:MAG: valine--tRNA ligase [Candidatus Yanofskybacteria bacterium CG10_big_fil_rev_8_21_14_0_10_36_16]